MLDDNVLSRNSVISFLENDKFGIFLYCSLQKKMHVIGSVTPQKSLSLLSQRLLRLHWLDCAAVKLFPI